MKPCSAVLGMILLAATGVVGAAPASPPPHAGPPACVPPPSCTPATSTQRLHFPANALSYGSPAAAFELQARGLRWHSDAGIATLTLRRPADYAGGDVEFALFHQILDDSGGDIGFIITPVSFNDGSGFETYGDEVSNMIAAPEDPTALVEQSALLQSGAPGYQWPPSGDWWYFEIRRTGTFTGPLRLMAVSIDY